MERKLIEISSKLETTLLDSVVHLDQHVNKRMGKLEIDVARQQKDFDDRLADDARHLALTIGAEVDALRKLREEMIEKVDNGLAESRLRIEEAGTETLKAQAAALDEISEKVRSTTLDLTEQLATGSTATANLLNSKLESAATQVQEIVGEMSTRLLDVQEMQSSAIQKDLVGPLEALSKQVGAEVEALSNLRKDLGDKVDVGLSETTARIEKAGGDALGGHSAALTEIGNRLDAKAQKLEEQLRVGSETTAGLVKARLEQTAKQVHASLGELSSRMLDAQDMQSTVIRRDLIAPLQTLKASIEATQKSVTSNPPASPKALAEMLGQTAQHMVSDERQILNRAVAQIADLEQKAGEMLARIDKAGRLNEALSQQEPATRDAIAEAHETPSELPFEALPRTALPAQLNWSAVVNTLSKAETQPNLLKACEQAARDPDIARVMGFFDSLVEELSQERVYPEDLKPEHAAPAIWARFGQGERGRDISSLAGISDDISNAITRSRLRNSPEFLQLAYRFVDAYVRLVERATRDIGVDHRLVEMAETGPGRCFMLLAGLLGAFERSVALPAETGFETELAANETGRPSVAVRS
jgi:hypothetical protein